MSHNLIDQDGSTMNRGRPSILSVALIPTLFLILVLCLAAINPVQAKDFEDGDVPWTPDRVDEGKGKIVHFRSLLAKASVDLSAEPLSADSTLAAPAGCPTGMSTYWKLDETSSGTYADAVGTNDGSCAGTCPSPTTDAKVGGAQQFNGSSGTGIDIPADAAFNWSAGDNFSIEYWLKTSSTCSGNEVIVGRQGTVHPEPHIWTGCSGTGEATFILLDDSGSNGGNGDWPTSGAVINDGKWHHIVVVKDATHVRLYMDGQEKDAVAKSYPSGFSSTTPFNLGYLNLGGKFRYNGILDEVALYSRALTPTEIKSHYYLARGYCEGCDTPVRIMPLGDSITVGNASGVVPDDAQHWVSYRKDLWESLNLAGYNVDFVGGQVNGDAFDPPFDSQHEGHGGWQDNQIASNIYNWLVSTPADVTLLHIGTNGLNSSPDDVEDILDEIDRYEADYDADVTIVLARIINRRDGSTTTTAFNDNVAAMAQDRVDNPANDAYPDKIIIVDMEDGVGMVYGQAPSSGDMWDNLHPYETGYAKMSDGWLNGDSFGSDGLVDFLPICAADTCPAGMISYWRLDDNSGSTAADSYDSHPGTLFDGPTWTGSGIVNGALTFDGNNDRVQVASSTDFDIATDGSFSAFTWFKKSTDCGTNAGSQNEVMLDRTYPGNHGSNTWWFGCGKNDDKLTIMFFPASKDAASEDGIITSASTVDNGQWHHGGWVYDGQANELRLYLDGQLQGTDQITLTADFDSTNPLCIGGYDVDGTCDTYEFNGTLDEVAVYNRALSLAEIQDQYNNGSGKDYCGAPAATGSITIVKDTNPAGGTGFNFSGDLGSFALDDGDNQAFTDLSPGNYDVTETLPTGWGLSDVNCTGGSMNRIVDGVTVQLGANEDITCTFTNDEIVVPTCPLETVAYYKLDEPSAPYVDAMGGPDATCTNCPSAATGIVSGSQQFDGSNDEVNVADSDQFDWAADDSFTIEYWMKKSTACTGNEVIVGRDDSSTSLHWWTGCQGDGKVRFQLKDVNNNGLYLGGTGNVINDGQWHHLVFVRDESADENRIYVDGLETHQGSHDYTAGFGSSVPLNIGYLNLGGHFRYDGLLDELAIHDRVLTDSEILAHYYSGLSGLNYCTAPVGTGSITIIKDTNPAGGTGFNFSGDLGSFALDDGQNQVFSDQPAGNYDITESLPTGWYLSGVDCTGGGSTPIANGVTIHLDPGEDITCTFNNEELTVPACPAEMISYWPLEETSGSDFQDIFDGNDAYCESGHCPDFATGLVGGALDFNGTDDYLRVPDDDSLDWASDDSFSVELWAKLGPNDCNTRNKVMIGRDNRPGGVHWWLGCNISDKAAMMNLIDTSDNGAAVAGTTPINDSQWHHIVAVRDESSDENRIYVDGVLEGTTSYNYGAGFDATTTLGIGYMAYTGTPDYYYNGLLDEVALYQRTLSESEILQHYNAGQAGLAYCEVQPLAPTITSIPETQAYVGIPYSYDVEADGYPAPTYTLTTKPAGMTIDEDTGLISWTPSSSGDYDVTVEAHNSAGFDDQSFTINVAAVTPCPANMSGYWRLDEATSGTYADSFGTNDGSCAGSCPSPISDGKVNRAQLFDGSSTGIDIPADTAFDWGANDSFTIEFWMKGISGQTCAGSGVNNNEVIVGRDDSSTSLHWWFGCANTTGYAHFQLGDKTGDSIVVEGPSISDGQWHHLVGVRDGVNGVNKLYVDGVEAGSVAKTYSAGFDSPTAALNLGWLNLSGGFHYEGTLDEVALYDRALSETEVKTHYYLARGFCEGCATPIRVMPLGDSITVGNASGVVPDNDAYWVSYRKELWESLNLAGYNVDFVGSQSDGYAFDPPFDSQHEGHGGWRDDEIASNIYNWLVSTPADVTLLHIGTNGLNSSPDDVEDILDEIDRYEADHDADVTVVLARIINRRDGSTTTTAFNNNVAAMAQDRVDNPANDAYPDKIIIVDMENGAGIVYGQAPASGDMWDNLHPYETGYAKMSNAWLYGDNFGSDGLTDFLPVCGPPSPTAPLITSAPVTDAFVGWPYSYDVEASGFPAPTFTLTTKLVGMTINQTTGLINWTPPTTGDYDVTVEAINSEGSDDQSFTINVVEAPACPADINSYWKLDESSAPYDNYIGGTDATCFNCPSATTGIVQGAQQFDGQNDEVNVVDNDQFEWSASDKFSIEYWMKGTSNCSGNEVVVGRQGVSHPNPHWWTGCLDSGDQAVFILFDKNGGDGGNGNWPTSGTDISDGQWHHVVAVKDATHLRIYVDGLEKDAVAKSYGAGFDSITPLNIGYLNLSDHYRFEGTLDEVAIYDKALSPTEIQQHYNAGLAGYGYCADWQEAPTITSAPITGAIVNLPYTYDVEADGFPVPTYTLTTKPAGMSIDENTGLITWMPAAVGDYDVTVEAHNSAGSDVQDYTINVIAGDDRITDGLLVLYPFDEGSGTTVHDRSGVGSALDLTIDDGGAISWSAGDCGLAINSSTVISSVVPAGKVINAAKASDEITIEGWVKPANTTQSGPARIVTLSQDPTPNGANFVLGQKQDQYDVRLRTTATDQNGNPSLSSPSGSLTTDLTHVVYTRDVTGTTKIYLDGSLSTSGSVSGDFSAWNNSYWLGLGNEPTGDRPWLGELYLVAVYGRALSQVEIQKNFSAGSCAEVPQYTLTVNVDGSGDVALDPAGGTYYYGQVVTMTATADPGWTFSDWSGDLTSTDNPVQITIDRDKVVTATFTQDEYTLTVNIEGQGSVDVAPDQATYQYGDVVMMTATADPGWTFGDWSGDVVSTTNPIQLTMDGDKVVTATFTQDEYTLTVNIDGQGSVEMDPDQTTYHYGDVITLTATADTGWIFFGWSGDATGIENPMTFTMMGDAIVTAKFIEVKFPVYFPVAMKP